MIYGKLAFNQLVQKLVKIYINYELSGTIILVEDFVTMRSLYGKANKK